MNCPLCSVELRMGDRFGIELDYCPQCRGVWLEKGKLDRILERASNAPGQPLARPDSYAEYRDRDHDHHHGDEHGQYGRRKRGFLADLFD